MLLKRVILLSLTVACVMRGSVCKNIDPERFSCSDKSPVAGNVLSTGSPPVDLTHIFCGNIGFGGRASGFHAHPGNNDPPCAVAEQLVAFPYSPLDCFRKLRIYDANYKKWVVRTLPGRNTFCFFPAGWSTADLVKSVQIMYRACKRYLHGEDGNLLCVRNYRDLGFDVILYMGVRMQGKLTTVISTAFPVPTGHYQKCQEYCNVGKSDIFSGK